MFLRHGSAGSGASPVAAHGLNSEEVDEAIIRTIFLKNKKNELFIQSSADLTRSTLAYEEKFKPKDERRRARFRNALAMYGGALENIPVLEYRQLGRKGFPSEFRSGIYAHLLKIDQFESKYGSDYFSTCLRTDIPSSIGRVIQADIPRTLSTFANSFGVTTKTALMKMLRDVLWAFAVHKPEIGYCQSLNFIAAFFISIFGSGRKSFYALVQLIDSPLSPYVGLHIPGYYSPGMLQLITDIGALERMARSRIGDKKYKQFFELREISNLSMIVSEWFHTLFVTVFPIRTVLRIFDFILSNSGGGNKILFRISFVILKNLVNQKDNLQDLAGVMQGHKKITRNWVDHNELIVEATRGLRLFSKKDLDKWRSDTKREMKRSANATGGDVSPSYNNSHPSLGSGGSGGAPTTMMRLEEAIAPHTRDVLTVPEDAVV